MGDTDVFADVEHHISAGDFRTALVRLQDSQRSLRPSNDIRFGTIHAELLHYLGDATRSSHLARELLSNPRITPDCRARLNCVLGLVAYETGQFSQSVDLIGRAVRQARECKDSLLFARCQIALFSVFSDAKNTIVPIPRDIARSVARSGDPHLIVGLRLCFARSDASHHNVRDARRHLSLAQSLLESHPNLWLQGRVHLGFSVVNALTGELEAAAQEAKEAIQCAADSGHVRTELAGLVNLSHALQGLGDFPKGKQCIDDVLERATSDVEIRVAALDSLANLLIQLGNLDDGAAVVKEIDTLTNDIAANCRSHWVESTLVETRVRLLQARGSLADADVLLRSALRIASDRGDTAGQNRLSLLRFYGVVASGDFAGAAQLLMDLDGDEHPSQVCERAAILGLAAVKQGGNNLARTLVGRAARLSRACGCRAFSVSAALTTFNSVEGYNRQAETPASSAGDLDTASTLLELGGHTHILGPEVLAAVHAAGCARGAALVAAGAGGPRVIEARGWDESQALAAARKPERFQLIPLGEHRDEPWQVVADPLDDLEHRCTFIAIRRLVATALTLDRYRREEKQRAALWPAEALDGDPESVWASEQMTEILAVARRIAPTPLSILLTGETGTGKEMLARAIHRASDRADRPFLPFNCTAVSRDMIESQLFGFRKGSFTGADASFAGVIRSAAGGTLFLDEIAEIGLDVQPKLLRFLETHEIHPLGESQPVKVDVRVIAATNAPLEQLVADGRLREDLFYRLNVVRLKLPPLRERREEIPPLVDHYLRRYGDEQKKTPLTLADETLEYLLLYAWPGNVRQLANEVRRMVAMAEPGATLTPAMLSPEIQASRRTIAVTPEATPEIRVRIDQPLPAAVQLLEQTMVRSALDRSRGRVEQAAKLLGISRKGLFLKRRRLGLRNAS